MKKLALMTAILTASAVAVPAMADNGRSHHYQGNASDHKYVKYNNGNGYGKYKNSHYGKKSKKYAQHHYTNQQSTTYRHSNLHKWPVPTTPNNNPSHRPVMMGQHH